MPTESPDDLPTSPQSEMIARVRATARKIEERVKKALRDTESDIEMPDGTATDVLPLPPSDQS